MRQTDEGGQAHRHEPHLEGHPGAEDDAGEDVPAQGVRSQVVGRAGGHEHLLEVDEIGVVGRQPGGEDGDHKQPQDQGQAGHGHAVPLQARPEFTLSHRRWFSVFSFWFSVKSI